MQASLRGLVDVLVQRELEARHVNEAQALEITDLKAQLAGLRCELEDARVRQCIDWFWKPLKGRPA